MDTWRSLASAAWGAPADPQFYGELDVDVGVLLEFASVVRTSTGAKVTPTHFVVRAVAHALAAVPELRIGRRYDDEHRDVFVIVDRGTGLSGVKLTAVDAAPVAEVARRLDDGAGQVRAGAGELDLATRRLSRLPRPLLRSVLRAGSWLAAERGIAVPALGVTSRPFGDAMVSSVGMWGVSRAFSPLAAYYRVPVLVLVGGIEQRPVAVAGKVVVRPMLTLTATFDHRRVDGSHAARFARVVRAYLQDPASHEPAPTPVRAGSGDERVMS